MTPAITPITDITLSDLGWLTGRGLVAMSARIARRALPLLRLSDDDAGRDAAATLAAAARAAAEYARGKRPADVAALARATEAAYTVAEAVCDSAGYTGYAAAHAARVGLYAARYAESGQGYNEIIASTFGAARSLFGGADGPSLPLVRAAVRADYDALLGLKLGPAAAAGEPVDPSEAGPLGSLWPAGTPHWFV